MQKEYFDINQAAMLLTSSLVVHQASGPIFIREVLDCGTDSVICNYIDGFGVGFSDAKLLNEDLSMYPLGLQPHSDMDQELLAGVVFQRLPVRQYKWGLTAASFFTIPRIQMSLHDLMYRGVLGRSWSSSFIPYTTAVQKSGVCNISRHFYITREKQLGFVQIAGKVGELHEDGPVLDPEFNYLSQILEEEVHV